MAKGIGRNGELFRELCDPAHMIKSARNAEKGKKKRPDAARFLLGLAIRGAETLQAAVSIPPASRPKGELRSRADLLRPASSSRCETMQLSAARIALPLEHPGADSNRRPPA